MKFQGPNQPQNAVTDSIQRLCTATLNLKYPKPSTLNNQPMIAVSDNMKPPWIVSQILRGFVAPLLPTWPITPSKVSAPTHIDPSPAQPLNIQVKIAGMDAMLNAI